MGWKVRDQRVRVKKWRSSSNETSGALGCGRVIGELGDADGPVDEERAAEDVLAGNEAPEAAVVAVLAIITHDEVAVGRNADVAVVDIGGKLAAHSGVAPVSMEGATVGKSSTLAL